MGMNHTLQSEHDRICTTKKFQLGVESLGRVEENPGDRERDHEVQADQQILPLHKRDP